MDMAAYVKEADVSAADRRGQLQCIVEYSHAMLERAAAGHWAEVMDLDAKRQEIIFEFFSRTANADEASWVADGIQTVLGIDKELVKLGKQQMKHVAGEIRDLNTGKRAHRAYNATKGY
jgi:hypothetical protein